MRALDEPSRSIITIGTVKNTFDQVDPTLDLIDSLTPYTKLLLVSLLVSGGCNKADPHMQADDTFTSAMISSNFQAYASSKSMKVEDVSVQSYVEELTDYNILVLATGPGSSSSPNKVIHLLKADDFPLQL